MPYSYYCKELNTYSPEEILVEYYDFHIRLLTALGKKTKPKEDYLKRQWELLAIPLRKECIIEHNGIIIGWLEVVAYDTSPTSRSIQISGDLLEPINDEGFYNEINALISNWANELGAKHAFIKVKTPYNKLMSDFLKGQLLDEQRYMEIASANVDRQLLQQWCDRAKLSGMREEMYAPLPEEYLADTVTIWNKGLRDIPNNLINFTPYFTVKGEIEKIENRKKVNTVHLSLLVFNADKIVGFSNILIWQNNPIAGQALTYVAPEMRNRGLAKYLKARLTLEVINNYPHVKRIATDCYVRNLPMIHINQQAGFINTKSGFDYSVELL